MSYFTQADSEYIKGSVSKLIKLVGDGFYAAHEGKDSKPIEHEIAAEIDRLEAFIDGCTLTGDSIKGHESQRRGGMTQLFRVYVNGGQVDCVDPDIAQKLARIHEINPDYRCSNLTFGDVPSVYIQSAGYDPRTTCSHWDIITQSLDKRPSP